VTFTAFSWLLKVSTPNKVATAGYVNPMVAVFLGWAFGGESLSLRAILASLVIIGAVALIITGRELSLVRDHRRVAPTPVAGRPEVADR
jgi:drug/metabolite transporter (DMT)-like permease